MMINKPRQKNQAGDSVAIPGKAADRPASKNFDQHLVAIPGKAADRPASKNFDQHLLTPFFRLTRDRAQNMPDN
jgi:hypothetical protein